MHRSSSHQVIKSSSHHTLIPVIPESSHTHSGLSGVITHSFKSFRSSAVIRSHHTLIHDTFSAVIRSYSSHRTAILSHPQSSAVIRSHPQSSAVTPVIPAIPQSSSQSCLTKPCLPVPVQVHRAAGHARAHFHGSKARYHGPFATHCTACCECQGGVSWLNARASNVI